MSTKIAVYPGTFDPVTFGHMDVIERASKLFDKVFVAVAPSVGKGALFTLEERFDMLSTSVERFKNVKAEIFDGLVVDYAAKKKAKVMVRGIRMISDFEYEFQMALTNRKLRFDIETVFMMPTEGYSYLSSKLIKEIARLGADVSEFVPKVAEKKLKEKFKL